MNLTEAERPNGHAHCRALAAAALGLPQRDGRPSAARTLAACVPGRAGRPARARDLGGHLRRGRAMKVKMILPALTEATGPYWRPIKYSLFPPLGLATLAAYLGDDCDVEIQDEHVEALDLNDAPDLVVIQVYITSANRAYRDRGPLPEPRRVRRARRTARDIAAGRGRLARRHDLPRPRRGHMAAVSGGFQARMREARVSIDAADAGRRAADSARSDQAEALPRPQLDRRLARVSARVRLLLQGGVLRRRPLVLYADRRCRAGRDRAPAGPSSVLPRRSLVRRPPLRHRRCSTACAAWGGCGRPPEP